MSAFGRFPDFSKIALTLDATGQGPTRDPWLTPEGLTVETAYDAKALEGLEQLRFLERGRRILCVEVEARGREFWELNNPSDVSKLESMMQRMGIA